MVPKLTEARWKQIAKDFKDLQNFPNCMWAVDGKHVNMQCTTKAGISLLLLQRDELSCFNGIS